MKAPDDYRFSRQHCWLQVDADIATIGISNHAQEELGDVVYVDLPEVGKHYQREAQCATIESVKTASDVYCPATGVVQEVNQSLQEQPDCINNSPYDQGWIFKLRLDEPQEVQQLLTEDAYLQETGNT